MVTIVFTPQWLVSAVTPLREPGLIGYRFAEVDRITAATRQEAMKIAESRRPTYDIEPNQPLRVRRMS
jgi:hypothetical protein